MLGAGRRRRADHGIPVGGLLMKRNLLAILLLVGFVATVKAALPLMVAAEIAAAVVESFVVRSVGRQVIATVGTAANDARWAQTFLGWANAARVVGSLSFALDGGKTLEVQVSPNATADMTKGPMGLMWKAAVSGSSCYGICVPAYWAADGVEHRATGSQYEGSEPSAVVAAALAFWNAHSWRSFTIYSQDQYGTTYQAELGYQGEGAGLYITLSGVNQEQQDQVKRVIGKPGAWSADSADPDWTAEEKTQYSGVQALRFRGANNDQLDIVPVGASAGALRYQQAVSPGQIRELATVLNNAYVPVSVSDATMPGSLAQIGEAAGSGTAEVVFPDDYARQGEAANAANVVAAAVESLKDSPNVDNPELPEVTSTQLKDSFYGADNPVTGLLGWSVPSHVATCPTAVIDFDWKLISYAGVLDGHCDIAEQVRSQAAVIFDACWLLLAFWIVLGA